MKIKKLGALLVSAALCAGMAAPAFAFEGEAAPVEQPVLPEAVDEDVVTVTDETSGALTPEGNLTLVDDYHTNYSDGSGQQFITLVSKSGNTFYLVIDRNSKGAQTVHFMNLVDSVEPDYPWMKNPNFAVFRHSNNQKWFALIMDIPRSRLGLPGDELLDVVNLKCDPLLIGSLRSEPGFFPAYHMNKDSWITVSLDNKANADKLKMLLDMSYTATASKIRKKH